MLEHSGSPISKRSSYYSRILEYQNVYLHLTSLPRFYLHPPTCAKVISTFPSADFRLCLQVFDTY
jgi:hypothetical protein